MSKLKIVGPLYSTVYQSVLDSFSTVPSTEDATAQNAFVSTLVDGGVWSELDRLFILASHASGTDSLLDWIHPTILENIASLVDSPTFTEKQGYLSNGTTSYINSNFNPTTKGVNYTQHNASLGFYCRTNIDEDFWDLGCYATNVSSRISSYRYSAQSNQVNGSNSFTSVVTNSLGFASTELTSATQNPPNAYKNGIFINAGAPKDTYLPNLDLYILCINSNGSPLYICNKQISMVYFGGKLGSTKQLILYNAFQTLMTYYGTQV
ncbi:MAG: hypothetical protein JRJ85_12175 [Deltaproteobacteria bacterium]|nr:hypothetical protein [Deltaproteobacteria bacterium]